ncbi:MAG: hypothetical protein KAJ24_04825 [Candidatus Aenigmarchaeota archaeon]|nr:hypothetical protein [Candidatus Aenigmarchaeota archaeon]
MNKLIVPGILLTAIIVLVAAGVNYGTIPQTGFSTGCTGFNDIALSSVDYLSNDPVIGGKSWVLTIVQNCQGRYAVGTFEKSMIQDSKDNAQAENDFKITTSLDEQKCEYAIQIQGNPIYHLNYETKNLKFGWGAGGFEDECNAKTGTLFFANDGWDYTCFWGTETAKHGILGTPSTTFKSTIKLESGGETKTATISNTGSRSVQIGDIGSAYWNGNLVTGDQCPSASDYRISAAYQSGVWKTIDENKYNEYLGHHQSELELCINRYIHYGTETPASCTAKYNVMESNALAGKKLVSVGGSIGETQGAVYNGKVYLEPVKALQYPMITLRLNVDWLGLFIPVGEPKVLYASSQDFRTGTTGIIDSQIQNVGSGEGAFNVYATCDAPFSQQGGSYTVYLAPTEVISVSIPITASASTETDGTCTICAQDINVPTKKHCRSVSVTVKPQLLCTPNDRRCNGNYIEQCLAAGTGWSTVQECDLGCEVKNNQPSCKTQTGPICGNGICETGETYETCSKDCGTGPGQSPIDYDTLGMVALALMIVIFAVVINKERTKKMGRARYGR